MNFGYVFNFEVTLKSEDSLEKCRDILFSGYHDFRFCVIKSSHKNTAIIHSMFGGSNITEFLIYLQDISDENLILRNILFTYHHCSGDPSKSGIVLFSEDMTSPLMVSVLSLLNSDIPKLISERFQPQTLTEFFKKGKQS